jgi:exopolysaccharide production protein ExoZ
LNKYDSIEALRFFAALAVIAFHLPILGFGEFGVDVFFIISGFVISLSTETETKYFFQKRLVRILPTYYFFTIGVFLLAVMFPPLLNNTKPDIFHLLKSLIPLIKMG